MTPTQVLERLIASAQVAHNIEAETKRIEAIKVRNAKAMADAYGIEQS